MNPSPEAVILELRKQVDDLTAELRAAERLFLNTAEKNRLLRIENAALGGHLAGVVPNV